MRAAEVWEMAWNSTSVSFGTRSFNSLSYTPNSKEKDSRSTAILMDRFFLAGFRRWPCGQNFSAGVLNDLLCEIRRQRDVDFFIP